MDAEKKTTTMPQFDDWNVGVEYALLCPQCGGPCLHHDRIDVYEPLHEDCPSGQHVIVEGSQTTITADLTGNPSGRRNGMTIRFWCENCRALPLLRISQHKGTTYVSCIVGPGQREDVE